MKCFFVTLLFLHGAIHLIGFANALGSAQVQHLRQGSRVRPTLTYLFEKQIMVKLQAQNFIIH